MSPAAPCHACPNRQRPPIGPPLCRHSGRSILHHIAAGACPAGRPMPPAQADPREALTAEAQARRCPSCSAE